MVLYTWPCLILHVNAFCWQNASVLSCNLVFGGGESLGSRKYMFQLRRFQSGSWYYFVLCRLDFVGFTWRGTCCPALSPMINARNGHPCITVIWQTKGLLTASSNSYCYDSCSLQPSTKTLLMRVKK